MELEKKNDQTDIRIVNMKEFSINPARYELRSGLEKDAPDCPYGNRYQWIGFDLEQNEYIRFTKSVFKKLINEK